MASDIGIDVGKGSIATNAAPSNVGEGAAVVSRIKTDYSALDSIIDDRRRGEDSEAEKQRRMEGYMNRLAQQGTMSEASQARYDNKRKSFLERSKVGELDNEMDMVNEIAQLEGFRKQAETIFQKDQDLYKQELEGKVYLGEEFGMAGKYDDSQDGMTDQELILYQLNNSKANSANNGNRLEDIAKIQVVSNNLMKGDVGESYARYLDENTTEYIRQRKAGKQTEDAFVDLKTAEHFASIMEGLDLTKQYLLKSNGNQGLAVKMFMDDHAPFVNFSEKKSDIRSNPKKSEPKNKVTEKELSVARDVKSKVNNFQDSKDPTELNDYLSAYGYRVKPIEGDDESYSIVSVTNDKPVTGALSYNDAESMYNFLDKKAKIVSRDALDQVVFKDPTVNGDTTDDSIKEDITSVFEGSGGQHSLKTRAKELGFEIVSFGDLGGRVNSKPTKIKVNGKTYDLTTPEEAESAFKAVEQSSKNVSSKKNVTEAEYNKLKSGDTYWYNGVEVTKE